MPKRISKALRTNVRNLKFTKEENDWVCWGLVYIGSKAMIQNEFEKKFGKSISQSKIQNILETPENQPLLEDIRGKHDRDLHNEYLASKRARVRELQFLYEKAKGEEKWFIAAGIISKIDDVLSPKKQMGDINLIQLEANNHYVSMPLEEIEKKKLELLDKYSRVIMDKEEVECNERKLERKQDA